MTTPVQPIVQPIYTHTAEIQLLVDRMLKAVSGQATIEELLALLEDRFTRLEQPGSCIIRELGRRKVDERVTVTFRVLAAWNGHPLLTGALVTLAWPVGVAAKKAEDRALAVWMTGGAANVDRTITLADGRVFRDVAELPVFEFVEDHKEHVS